MSKVLRVVSLNARSVVNKASSLEDVISCYQPHVLVITETWLHADVQDSEVIPSSYKLIRKDRESRGGGVAIAIKNNVAFTVLDGINNHESVWCRIKFLGKRILLGGVYRPPSSSPEYLEAIQDYLADNTNSRSRIIITGDFNLPGINWADFSYDGKESRSADILITTAFNFCLQQLVSEATRVDSSSSSLLDLALVSSSFQGCSANVEEGISDHKLLAVSCPVSGTRSFTRPSDTFVRDYTHADDNAILEYLESRFDCFSQVNDVNEMWSNFREIVLFCEQRYVPLKKKRVNREYPWFTREMIHLKRKIKRQRKRRNTSDFSSLTSKLRELTRSAKESFFSDTLPSFMKNEPQKFWRYLSKDKRGISEIRVAGESIVDATTIANKFNVFFQSVFTRAATHAQLRSYDSDSLMPEVEITEDGVLCLLHKLDVKKSPGPDELSNTFLSRYAVWVAKYLHRIYTASLDAAVIPDDWRSAKIIPVHKSGSTLEVNNYRPVSLTSTCCKLFEHIIFKAMITYLENNKLLYAQQHGFRSGLSTVTQLAEITDDLIRTLNLKGQTDAIFLDFSKAFDVVPHQNLITKLLAIGIEQKVVAWIASYLSNRRQCVTINGCLSKELAVHSGVPQGSVLGPLLFLVYINDIYFCVEPPIQIKLFADDCVVYTSINNQEDQIKLNDALRSINEWCIRWGLKINRSKTNSVTFTNKTLPLHFTYFIGNAAITRADRVKYLGVTLTSNLSWETHVENVCSGALKKLSFLKRKLRNTPPTLKLKAYKALVRPKLEYADIIWSPWQQYLIKKIERVQNLALRFIYSAYSRQHSVTNLRNRASLQILEQRRIISRLKFVYQLDHGDFKLSRERYLQQPSKLSARTNHNKTFRQPPSHINAHKFALFPRAIFHWNALPAEVVNAASTASFTQQIEKINFTI